MRTGAACFALAAVLVLVVSTAGRRCSAGIIGPNVGIATTSLIENEPDVAGSQGHMVVVWYRGNHNDHVGWGYSLDDGATWVGGGGLPYNPNYPYYETVHGLPTVCADANGGYHSAALLERSLTGGPVRGDVLSVYRGGFQGSVFMWNGPRFATPLAEVESYDAPHLACDPSGDHIYLAYTFLESGSTIQLVRSTDGGETWSAPLVLSGPESAGARVTVGPDGEVYVVWMDLGLGQVMGRRSDDGGASFGPMFVVSELQPSLVNPPLWSLNAGLSRRHPLYPGDNLYRALDVPAIAVDRSSGPTRGRVYVAWAEAAAGAVQPQTGGASDNEPNDSYVNAVPVEIGYDVSGYIPDQDSPPYTDRDLYAFEGAAGTTVWVNGQYWSNAGYFGFYGPNAFGVECGRDTTQVMRLGDNSMYDLYCPCAPLPPLVLTLPADERYYLRGPNPSGPYFSYYGLSLRRYEVSPGQAARDQRDVVLAWSQDGGATWSAKRRVNDDAPQFDNTFPEVAVDRQGRVLVAWYDRREDASCGGAVQTYGAWSWDGGETFLPVERLSELSSAARQPWRVGDHMCLEPVGDGIWALWSLVRDQQTDVMGAFVGADVATGIAVSGLAALVAEGGVRLTWRVQEARELLGFRLERAVGAGGGFLPLGADVLPADHDGAYSLEDRAAEPGHRYHYRLEVLRSSGGSDWLGPVGVWVPEPAEPMRWTASPNPFAESVELRLTLARAAEVEARVYDIAGHQVSTLHRGRLPAGTTRWTWDGRARSGPRVPPGIYVVRAEADGRAVTHRLTRLR